MKTKLACITGLLTALVCAHPAHAAVIMTLEQVGANVVANGTGTVNLAGLSPLGGGPAARSITPSQGALIEGNGGNNELYGGISGPSNFGPGGFTPATTGTGDPLAINGIFGDITVPFPYQSGTPLSSTATWTGTTLSALGATPGTYTWTWGTGANADSLTLEIGVPEPAPALLLTLAAAALALLKRIRK